MTASDSPHSPPQDLIEEVLRRASSDATVVIAHRATEANVRFAANKLTTSGEAKSTSISVVSVKDGAYGTCRGDVTELDQAVEILRRSEEAAAQAKKAPDYFELVGAEEAAALEPSYREGFEPSDSLEFFEHVTPGIDATFAAASKAKLLTFGYVSFTQEAVYLGTSTGTRAGYSESKAYIGMTTKPEDYSRSVWSGQTIKDLGELDIEAAFEKGRGLLESASRQINLDPGKYTCVLSPSCVADMLLWMYWMMSLRDADEGKTAFSNRKEGGNRIGEAIYPEGVSLWSDPAAPGVECVPFVVTAASHSLESVFDNGYPLTKSPWIENGIQKSLVAPRQYAAVAGVEPSPMVANLLLAVEGAKATSSAPDARSKPQSEGLGAVESLISNVERGLYVNCLWYIRLVDPQTALLTGLTRDGVFLIEDGKIVAEVNNFRFNQSPLDMLSCVVDAGPSELATPREFDDVGIWVSAPALTVADFNMSTVSEAQ
jgi:predicted Zn-dependent protease